MYPTSQGNRIFRGAVVKPKNFRDNHCADKDLVSVNVQHSQEYASTSEGSADRAPLLEELPESETLPEEAADILNQASSMVASGEDDLPLGTDANTLSGIPSGTDLSSHGSQIDKQPASPLIPPKSSPSHTSSSLSAGKTHPWLQALSGKQQSFGSDLSTGTNSSVNSIEILLQGREADPEEILMSLGFGSTEDNTSLTSRIPSRFLMLSSETSGVSIDDLLGGQRSELQELLENWNSQKCTSGNWNHSPRLTPYLHGIRFLTSVRAAAACKSSSDHVDNIPNSILTPDNQLALAKQGYYDSFPSSKKEESFTTKSINSPTTSQPLSAAEKRQKFKSTRSSRPWSLIIESETNTEQYPADFRPSTSTVATSIDSSISSDNVDRRSWSHSQRSVSELRWSYLNSKSRDSVSSSSSISQARQIQVSKLMNNEDDDGDYQLQPLSPQMFQISGSSEDVFLADQPKGNPPVDCSDSQCTDISSTATQTSPVDSSWKSRWSVVNDFGGDCLCSPIKESTPEKYANLNLGYLADGETSYLESEVARQNQDPYRDAVPSSIDLEDPNANHLPRDSSDFFSDYQIISKDISSEQDENLQNEVSASQEKSPVICRFESAQSDSSGFAEPETEVVVNIPFQNLDSLSVHKSSCDSFDTISSSRLQRLSINSDTTIKELSDQSPYAFDADFTQITVCDKSTSTDLPLQIDKEILTETTRTGHKAVQTDACSWCQCSSGPRYKPPMLGQLSKSTPIGTPPGLLSCAPITDDPLVDVKNLTSFDSGFSPSKHEVSVLNLYVYNGKIWFCDNDSNQSSKWSISGGQSTSSVHLYDQVCQELADSADYAHSTRCGEFGEFSHLKQITTMMNLKPSSKSKLTPGHMSLDFHEDDHPRKPIERLNTKEQIREYKKLLKLTNQRFSFQCLMKNTTPMYSPRFQIDIWCERHIDEHLQEENQLMQYAVQRYKSDLQVMESAFLTEFNRSGGLLSEEDTLLMDELYELWTDISLEVVHLERLLADRQRLIRRGECELTTLTTLDVIQTMVEVLKEQLYLFHINNDIVKSSTCDQECSPGPIYHHPGWKDISNEVHELRHQITGHDRLQAIHLKKAVEEIKDTVLSEFHQEVTHNLSKLSAR